MESLYAEAAACTQGEERVRTLLESIRLQATAASTADRMELATRVAQQAIFELETRAVEVDGLLEACDFTPPNRFASPSLATLEAIDRLFTQQWDQDLLGMAAQEGDVAVVDLMIQAGVDPSTKGNWAIRYASESGHLPVVNRLLQDKRLDTSACADAFRDASTQGHMSIVNRLLQDERMDPSAQKNWPIQWASRHGHLSIVDHLLRDRRVDPSANGNNALLVAAEHGQLAVVDRLLQDERVSPERLDFWFLRMLQLRGFKSIVDRLLQDKRVSLDGF